MTNPNKNITPKAKVTGVGGVFLKSPDPKALSDWYKENLGITPADDFIGAVFPWLESEDPSKNGATILGLFDKDSDYFGPSGQRFMINFRVDNLDLMLDQLRRAGCTVKDKIEDMEGIGRFGWFTDPDGRMIELWEPSQ